MPRLTLFIDTGTKICSYDINPDGSITVFGPENYSVTVRTSGEKYRDAARRAFIQMIKDIDEVSKMIDDKIWKEHVALIDEEKKRQKSILESSEIAEP